MARNSIDRRRRSGHTSSMEHRRLVSLSKRMSLALRHDPGRFGLVLDMHGWVLVDDLLSALSISRPDFDAIVAGNDKRRFGIERTSEGAERVRAHQGHSVPVELDLKPAVPPSCLYHGTSAGVVPAIRARGLLRGARLHVHLSPDVETAHRVGARRKGAVVVLRVDSGAMARDGHKFFLTANGVWLVDFVPPAYVPVSL